ncbi:MAG: shikimate dehydrogenase [Mycobacterium sp.]
MVARKAAVLGSPVAHSRSPQLHLAAYRALGLVDWTYERIECTADELPTLVSGFGPEWVGVSVTMPGKFAALQFADERTERAELVGSANTLVRTDRGWRADNTDIDGVAGALAHLHDPRDPAPLRGDRAIVLGSGGTAPAAVAALAGLGATEITVVARDAAKAARLVHVGSTLGALTIVRNFTDPELPALAAAADVLVSTIPADAAAGHASGFASVPVLLDAIYDPWPTPLASAVTAAGGEVISGLQMLLNQAFSQVEQFTGRPAPRREMTAALG